MLQQIFSNLREQDLERLLFIQLNNNNKQSNKWPISVLKEFKHFKITNFEDQELILFINLLAMDKLELLRKEPNKRNGMPLFKNFRLTKHVGL